MLAARCTKQKADLMTDGLGRKRRGMHPKISEKNGRCQAYCQFFELPNSSVK